MKLNIFSTLILAIIFTQGVYSQDSCPICLELRNNVVNINTVFDDGSDENGFGFVISERNNILYIVTAKHVIHDIDGNGVISLDKKTKSVSVIFFSDRGRDYPATLLNLPNTNLDIALFEVNKPENYSWQKDFYSTTIQREAAVWFIGRNKEWYIPTGGSVGSVNNISPDDEIFIDINSILPGTSGAPLISQHGIVGLIFKDAAGGARAYSIKKVEGTITDQWNYPWQMNLNPASTPNPPKPNEDRTVNPNQVDLAWTEIENENRENNKIRKLEDYVSKGQGSYLEEARKMYEGYLWANINRPRYMDKYVQHFPNGQYIIQVEDLVYRRVGPETYLGLFPNGRYVDQATKKLLVLAAEKEEDELWSKIQYNRPSAIENYLEKFPEGKYITQIEDFVWKNALEKESENTSHKAQGFEQYIKYFPQGKHRNAALGKIKRYR